MRGPIVRRRSGFALGLALLVGVGGATARGPGERGAEPRAVAVRRSQIRSRLQAFRLRQPGRAEGRHDAALGDRHLRQPEPVYRQGRRGGRHRPDLRHADAVLRGRARQRIRPRRRKRRSRPGPQIGAVHAAQGGALSRRLADDAGGRDLDLRHAAREGPADVPLLLRRRRPRSRSEGERGVRFHFKSAENRELPQIVGQMPILSKKYWEGRDFTKTTLDAPLGSGPYKVEAVDPGRSITYRRVPDYWARRPAGPQGPQQCRRDPLRLLPRRDDRARGAARPGSTTCGWRIRRKPGRPGMTARRCGRV